MKHNVALVYIDSYDEEKVYNALKQAVDLLGGIAKFIQQDEKVLLKPNLLSGALPQRAITTHPSVFSAAAKLLQDAGIVSISYGDSPGNPTTTPAKASVTCGIAEAAEKLNIATADFSSGSVVTFPSGKVAHSFYICNGVQQADAIINVCKMKTHALERITGAVKNMYGCIFGINKGAGHVAYPSSEIFADMLADLNLCLRPRLHIMDGILAMEGNGPTSGTPIAMNVLLVSEDPVALDTVFAALINLEANTVPTCVSGASLGLGVMDPSQIAILTPDGTISFDEAYNRYGNGNFDVLRTKLRKSFISKILPLLPAAQAKPKVNLSKCVACGICEKACPVPEKAVKSGNGEKAKYDYKKCIKCFCCQEMCPAKAIEVHRSPFAKIIGGK